MNRLTVTPFFQIISNSKDNITESIFDEFTLSILNINDSIEQFVDKFRILNYTKIRLQSMRAQIEVNESKKKHSDFTCLYKSSDCFS